MWSKKKLIEKQARFCVVDGEGLDAASGLCCCRGESTNWAALASSDRAGGPRRVYCLLKPWPGCIVLLLGSAKEGRYWVTR
jgi:hypothetical protein